MHGTDENVAVRLSRFRIVSRYQAHSVLMMLAEMFPRAEIDESSAVQLSVQWSSIHDTLGELSVKLRRRARCPSDPAAAAIEQLRAQVGPLYSTYRTLLGIELTGVFGGKWRARARNAGMTRVRERIPTVEPVEATGFSVEALSALGGLLHWYLLTDAPDDWSRISVQCQNRCDAAEVTLVTSFLTSSFRESLANSMSKPICWQLPSNVDALLTRLDLLSPKLVDRVGSLKAEKARAGIVLGTELGQSSEGALAQLNEAATEVLGPLWAYVPTAAWKIFGTGARRFARTGALPAVPFLQATPNLIWTGHLCIGFGVLAQLSQTAALLSMPHAIENSS